MKRKRLVAAAWLVGLTLVLAESAQARQRHLLYVATPGIRNYVEHGGVGVLVFDIDDGHRFVRRIPTLPERAGEPVENVKGIVASAATGRLYVSTIKRVMAFDLRDDRPLWNRTYEGGADRLAGSPDGKLLYVPSLEGDSWNVVDGKNGELITRITPKSGAHNTIFGPSGRRVYLAGLRSPLLSIVDVRRQEVVATVGPFSAPIRPFTVDGSERRIFANVNDLLGFEVGDLRTGKVLARVSVTGFEQGPTKRHGCPSHGVALSPDEKELWLADAHNSRVHVFDAKVMPPRQLTSIPLRDQPGWISFSIDGARAYPSTGEVIDARTKKIMTTLTDEQGRAVHSEKLLEIVFDGNRPVRAGDQFGIGGRR